VGVYPSESLNLTLSINEKVEQHIKKKTHKPNALRFWVEGGVILLCGFGSCLILVRSPWCFSHRFSSGFRADSLWHWPDQTSTIDPCIDSFSDKLSDKHVPFKCVVNDCRLW